MNTKRLLSAFTLFATLSTCVLGQKLPAKCEVFKPNAIIKDILKESDTKSVSTSNSWGQKTSNTGKYWIVFSDRSNNTTYSTPNGSGTSIGKLDFNEKVRIAQIQGDYALVYTEKIEGSKYPNISNSAECRGWVPMNKLLLWSSCPTNEKGIYYKALLSANLDKASNENEIVLGRMFLNPDDKNTKDPSKYKNLTSDMNFYFIMKRSGDLVLLAKQYRMEGNTDQVLLGWVHEASFVGWNQRSCLEPNWDPDIVENQFKGENVKVYKNSSLSGSGTTFAYGSKNGDKDEYSQYRMPPSALRFPILDNDSGNDNVYKCSSFSTGGASLAEINQWQETLNRERNKVTENIMSANLIVAIDGTSSMENYFPAVKEALKEGINYFKSKDKVRIGIVVYRDYPDGDHVSDVLPLCRPDDPRIAKFLDDATKYKPSPLDKTHTEALYKGIQTAINPSVMGFNKEESNLLLVVGDCGNDPSDNKISQSSLIEALEKNNFMVMSFQVRTADNSQPWQLFNLQMSQIVKSATDMRYKELKDIKTTFKLNDQKEGYDLIPEQGHRYYVGSTRRPVGNGEMAPSKLVSLIKTNFGTFTEALNQSVNVITNFDFNSNTNAATGTFAIDEAYVKSKMSAKFWEAAKNSNTVMTFMGYTPKKDKSGNPYWNPVVYISKAELEAMLSRLKPVNDVAESATATSADRKKYIDAMKAVLRGIVPDRTDEELERMGNSEITNMISGLNEGTEGLSKGPSLTDISEPKAVSNDEFLGLVHGFTRKYKKLTQILGTSYKYMVENNNTRYYWIPMEDMP